MAQVSSPGTTPREEDCATSRGPCSSSTKRPGRARLLRVPSPQALASGLRVPVAEAVVTVVSGVGEGSAARTNTLGEYVLPGVIGSVTLSFSAEGFATTQKEMAVEKPDFLNVELTPLVAPSNITGAGAFASSKTGQSTLRCSIAFIVAFRREPGRAAPAQRPHVPRWGARIDPIR